MRNDKTGKTFGRWVVLGLNGHTEKSPHRSLWLCRCACGTERTINSAALIDGVSQSCGCLHKERVSASSKTHGLSKTKMYKVWTSMKGRCRNPNDTQYHLYGGRGIQVFGGWVESFELFSSYMGDRPQGMSLDRIDNNGNYEPGNVRWATGSEQLANTRRTILVSHDGKTMCLRDWSRELGVYYNTLRQ